MIRAAFSLLKELCSKPDFSVTDKNYPAKIPDGIRYCNCRQKQNLQVIVWQRILYKNST